MKGLLPAIAAVLAASCGGAPRVTPKPAPAGDAEATEAAATEDKAPAEELPPLCVDLAALFFGHADAGTPDELAVDERQVTIDTFTLDEARRHPDLPENTVTSGTTVFHAGLANGQVVFVYQSCVGPDSPCLAGVGIADDVDPDSVDTVEEARKVVTADQHLPGAKQDEISLTDQWLVDFGIGEEQLLVTYTSDDDRSHAVLFSTPGLELRWHHQDEANCDVEYMIADVDCDERPEIVTKSSCQCPDRRFPACALPGATEVVLMEAHYWNPASTRFESRAKTYLSAD